MVHRDTALSVGGFRGILEDFERTRWHPNGNGSVGGELAPIPGLRGPRHVVPAVELGASHAVAAGGRHLSHTPGSDLGEYWEAMHIAHLNVARSFAGADWWTRGLVERRAGVTAWNRFRDRRAERRIGRPGRQLARDLSEHPLRTLGVVEMLAPPSGSSTTDQPARSRAASRRSPRSPGRIRRAIPEHDRYEVDLSTVSSFRAFLQLAKRPSGAAIVDSRSQAALGAARKSTADSCPGLASPGSAWTMTTTTVSPCSGARS